MAIVIGLCASTLQVLGGLPVGIKWWRSQKTLPVHINVDRLGHLAREYAARQKPPRLPIGQSDWTPKSIACRPFWSQSDVRGQWASRPWTELGFSVDELPYSMQFKYVSDGRALQLAVRADFDCDGRPAAWRCTGVWNEDRVSLSGPEITNEHY